MNIRQLHTIASAKQLDENITLLNYYADYDLDGLLEKGPSSVGDLLVHIGKLAALPQNSLKIGSAKGGGCTTFNAVTPDGDAILGRNFDFKTAPCLVVWTRPKNAYASISVVDNNFLLYGRKHHKIRRNGLRLLLAPYCAVDGINEKGLSIAVLQIKARATKQTDASKKNITTTAMIRAVLDKCATIDEAVELISSYNMHDSLFCCYHYRIIDASGRSVIVEYINDEIQVFERGSEKYSVDGSHFEDDDFAWRYACNYSLKKDVGDFKIDRHGEDRVAAVNEALSKRNGTMTELEAMDLLSHVKLDYDHPSYPWRIGALWSAVYNANKATLKLVGNIDYSKVYNFAVSEPMKVQSVETIEQSEYERVEWEYL